MQRKKQERQSSDVRLNKRQAYPLIEQYFKSGLLPRDFYNQVGWSDNQFFSWRKRYMEEHNMLSEDEFESSMHFHPVEITPDKTTLIEHPQGKFTLEITYPNGVMLRVYSQESVSLSDLIKLY